MNNILNSSIAGRLISYNAALLKEEIKENSKRIDMYIEELKTVELNMKQNNKEPKNNIHSIRTEKIL